MKLKPGIRLTSVLASTVILLAVLASVFFISAEADHECSGENCPVCLCIIQAEHLLEQISSGCAVLISAAFILPLYCIFSCFPENIFRLISPVTQKTRLNN